MARFFFHVVNDVASLTDEEGTECDDLKAACRRARAVIGGIIADEIASSPDVLHLAIMIDDENGRRVADVTSVTNIAVSAIPFAS